MKISLRRRHALMVEDGAFSLKIYYRTKSVNQPLVIQWPIGGFELGIGVFMILEIPSP